MSAEDLEKYETEMELQLYREYRDIVRQFSYVVETERRFYLANSVDGDVQGRQRRGVGEARPRGPESGALRRLAVPRAELFEGWPFPGLGGGHTFPRVGTTSSGRS